MLISNKMFSIKSEVTKVPVTTQSKIIMGPNKLRSGLIIFNPSGSVMQVAYGSVCAWDNVVTVSIKPNESWAMPYPIWLGELSAIKQSGSADLVLTESFMQTMDPVS